MMKKSKKGQGVEFFMKVVLLLLAAGVLAWVLWPTGAKAAEKSQVELCRGSNSFRVGTEHMTSDYVAPPRFCNAIDKTSGKEMVPTKNYPQKEVGAAREVRDMIKDCWYMWLEGAEPNILRSLPGDKGCRICYAFKIKDKISFDAEKVVEALNEPYFASDTSDRCDVPNGGFLRDSKQSCTGGKQPIEQDESSDIEEYIKTVGGGQCCRKTIMNECYNKGGKCYKEKKAPYEFEYTKWACPKSELKCFVKPDNVVTYIEYIVEGNAIEGKPAGEFIAEATSQNLDYYPPDVKYAISFMSPARERCGGFWGCLKKNYFDMGPSGKVINLFSSKESFATRGLVFLFGPFTEVVLPKFGTFGRHSLEDIAVNNDGKFGASAIILSTYETAQKMGCTEE